MHRPPTALRSFAPTLLTLTCLVALLVGGCAPKVSVGRVDAAAAYRDRTASVLTGEGPSERTMQVLRSRDLMERWEREPDTVLRGLLEEQRASIDVNTGANNLTPAVVELLIARAERVNRRGARDLTYFLLAAELAHTQIRRDASYLGTALDTRTAFLTDLNNRAISRVVSLTPAIARSLDGVELEFEGFGGAYSVEQEGDAGDWAPGYFDRFVSANEVVVGGMRNHHRLSAYGVPLVGVRDNSPERDAAEPFMPPEGMVYAVTLTVDFEPIGDETSRAVVTLHDPRRESQAWLGGVRVRLSEDLTAPVAYLFSKTELGSLGQSALPNPHEYVERIGIYMHEPDDPDRLPVLMVHGLRSSPLTWRDALNDLNADPALRGRYQFWMFLYPTGLPIPRSSAYLREAIGDVLDAYDPERTHPGPRSTVMVGHSMGGVLTSTVLREVGSGVYDAALVKPIDELNSPDFVKDHLREVFFYEPLTDVRRAVFIAAPFRGSPMADGLLASIGRTFIRLPDELRDVGRSLRELDRDAMAPGFDQLSQGVPTSVHNLSPSSPFLLAYDAAPMVDVPHHVIVGDRGRNDGEDASDGVVPFWSSRMDTAASTLAVPAGHAAHEHPLAIRELARILRAHLEAVDGGG